MRQLNEKKPQPYGALMAITPRPDAVFTRGEGDFLWDDQGRRFIDWIQGWAVNSLGHRHPVVCEALVQQSEQLLNCSPAFYNRPMLELAQTLTQNSAMDQVFFTNSGAEANEGAIKLARKWGQQHRKGAYEIISFEKSFHGRTLATMAATGKAAWQSLFPPVVPGFKKARYNDIESVAAQIDENTVAIMLEPVQGEGGVIPAETEFMVQLRQLADDNNLLLILDEVQTGIGRCGSLFCYEQYPITPDIVTLGKGLGGGVPIAALMARQSVCCFAYGDQGGTFNGNALMCHVAGAVVEHIRQPVFMQALATRITAFEGHLARLTDQYPGCTWRGRGLLLALELPKPVATEVAQRAFDRGLLLNAPQATLLRFMPALNISEHAMDEGFACLAVLLADSL